MQFDPAIHATDSQTGQPLLNKAGQFRNKPGPKKGRYTVHNLHLQPTQNFLILTVLHDLMAHFKRRYCFPSQAEICKRLEKFHQYKIGIRQLNNLLKYLEDSGQISRTPRPDYEYMAANPTLGTKYRSTLYKFSKRGWRLMWRFKNRIAGSAIKKIKAALWGQIDRPGQNPDEYADNYFKVRELLSNIGEQINRPRTRAEPA